MQVIERKIIGTTAAILTMASLATIVNTTEVSAATKTLNTSGKVKTVDSLNVRSGAGTKYKAVGRLYTGNKVTITATSNGWYKIKSGNLNGWVSGKYITVTTSNASTNKGIVNANTLNVRKGAGTRYSVVEKISKGKTVTIYETLNGWYKVKTESGKTGYVSSNYITIKKNDSSTQSSSTTINKNGYVNASSLNIRKGAGTNHSVLTTVKRNAAVKIIEKSGDWYKVTTENGKTGWCSSKYITIGTNQSSSLDSSVGSSQNKVDAVIKLAKAQIGKPYVWGSEGPNSFDCSGFTKYVYKNAAGINIPRVSREQAKYGTYVSTSNMKPGDIIYFDSTGNGVVNHVGMYLGNGEWIHSPRTGDRVKIEKTTSTYFKKYALGARRIMK